MINKLSCKRVISSILCFAMVFFYTAPYVLADSSNISGITPVDVNNHKVYNIEAASVSGSTGFRQYNNFDLSKNDVANLIYKDYSKFVNLVDNRININGIVNTMKDNNFYNGHAIFVSPKGIVIGASGILNVGSLTLMAPSENAYNSFKNSYGDNLKEYEFNLKHENYKNLINNSSGLITINGRIFAREEINAYGRTINISKEKDSSGNITEGAITPGLFAGWKDTDTLVDSNSQAEEIFNTLVSNNITNADSFDLKDGKISLITNKENEENIVFAKNIEESGKKYKQTKTINTDTGLKTVTKEELKDDGTVDDDKEKDIKYSIDKTYEKNSLSENDSKINIEDTNIAANDIKITAKAETGKKVNDKIIENYGKAAKEAETEDTKKDETTGYKIPKSFRDTALKAEASVTIKNSKIGAEKVEISADAKSQTETYIQLLDPIWEKWLTLLGADILIKILSAQAEDTEIPDGIPMASVESVKSYFSDSAYKDFEGSKSISKVSLENAVINTSKSIDISSDAKSVTKISTGKLDSHELFFYGLGSSTDSKVNIKNSKLTANGNSGKVNISAFSEIENKIEYDSSNFLSISEKEKDGETSQQGTVSAYNFTLLNNTVISDTDVNISDDTTIETKDLKVKSVGFNQNEINVKNISNVGKNSDKSGIAAGMIINHTDTKSKVTVKDSNLKTSNDTILLSQNINATNNTVNTEVKAEDRTYEIKDKDKEVASYDPTYTIKAYDWLNKKFLGKVTDKIGNVIDKANLEISGSAIWNDENNQSSAIVDNSVINAKTLDINSNMIDFTLNNSTANATANNKFGVGTAIIVNGQENTNNAEIINGSKITAKKGVNLNATTQLPMNPFSLKIGQTAGDMDLYVGVGFDQNDSITNWDAEFLHTQLLEFLDLDNLKSVWKVIKTPRNFIADNKIEMDGLFNNLVKAEGTGTNVGVAGSVLANSILNNTSSFIDGSEVTVDDGNVVLNSANSVINYNGAGKVDLLLDGVNELIAKIKAKEEKTDEEKELISKFGIGGSVLVGSYTNNTNSYINNSTIKAEKGDINVNAATEEGYINLSVTGTNAETLAVAGSVNVQRIDGKTKAYIDNSNTVKASNVTVNAGKASIKTKKKDDEHSDDINLDDDNELYVNDARDVEDMVLNITVLGVNSQQEGSGVSLGASVNVTALSKEIMSYINNSTVNAAKDLSVLANTESKKIDVILAGAFAGGISADKEKQEKNNNGSPDSNGGQKMANVGNWMDEIDKAGDDEEDVMNLRNLFDENDANEQGKKELNNNKNLNQKRSLRSNNKDTMTGSENQTANTDTANSNLSLALAGAIDVTNDYTKITSKIIDSTVNAGEKINVTSDNNTLAVLVNGGLAKADTVSAGAGVNIYNNKSETTALIEHSTVNFTSENAKELNIISDAEINLIDATAGIGVSAGKKGSIKSSAGGSFGFNKLKNTVTSTLKNSTVKKEDNTVANPDVTIEAKDDTKVCNVTGAAGLTKDSDTGIGAGIAATLDFNKKDVEAVIINSIMTDVKDTTINAEIKQDYSTIAIAAAMVTGSSSGFTFDGAVNTELNLNKIIANATGSQITSTGIISIIADEDIKNQSLAGGVEFSTSSSGFGVGIGGVVNVNNSKIQSEINNLNIEKSNEVEIKAEEKEDNKFLAANLGLQTSGNATINVNGIANVFVSEIVSNINNSNIKSDGNVSVDAIYDNTLKGITVVGNASKGVTIGANLLGNVYNNTVSSKFVSSEISKAKDVKINATSVEEINLIPIGVAITTNKGAVGANINVNIVKNTVEALINGDILESTSVVDNAYDETTVKTRGGTVSAGMGVALSASLNVDVISKNVTATVEEAKIVSSGETNILATSINSMGGTKNSQGKYDRDDVTTDTYRTKMLNKSDDKYTGIKYNSDFENWNMFYDLSGASTGGVAGAVIIKTINNNVKAEIVNSDVKSDSLSVFAEDYSIKNIIAGSISGAGTAAFGVQVLYTNDRSTTNALVRNNTKLDITDTINIRANNRKDSHNILVAASGAGTVAGSANVIVNNNEDISLAKIDNANGENGIKAGTLNVEADENMNASHIVVGVDGAGTVAIAVNPVVNKYNGTVDASINNAKVSDAAINVNAKNDIETFDLGVGIAGSGFVSGVGAAIENNYIGSISSIINNSVINTTNNINVDAYSLIKSENWLGSLAFAVQGAAVAVNVILNNITSATVAAIKDSTIEKSGDITINSNKNKQDNIKNTTVIVAGTAIGASLAPNVIQNKYANNVSAYLENSSSNQTGAINISSNSKRLLDNTNIGAGASGIGATVGVSAVSTSVDTTTYSYINAKDKTMDNVGAITIRSNDNTDLNNKMGTIQIAGLGVAAGVNLDMSVSDNSVKAEILSATNGQINAQSADIKTENILAIDKTNVGVSLGAVGLAGDYVLIQTGKRTGTYDQSEQDSSLVAAINKLDSKYTPTATASDIETGSVSRINGNLKTNDDISVAAESKIKGKGNNDKLTLSNTTVTVGLGAGSVGVKEINLASNTDAGITGGTVQSTGGNISSNAKSTSNVEINSVEVNVSGINFAGGSAIYQNSSETTSKIKDATVKANNIDINSESTSNSNVDATFVTANGLTVVAVDLAENKDVNKSVALVTGNTNIDAVGKLTVHSKANTDLTSKKQTVRFSGATHVRVSKNEVNSSTIARAIIENVNGTINTNGLDIITDYDRMNTLNKTNVIDISLVGIASVDKTGAFMNSSFKSGIDSPSGLVLNNTGDTNIITARDNGTNGMVAKGEIYNVKVSIQDFVAVSNANAQNTAKSETVLKSNEFNTNNLNINSYLNSSAKSESTGTKVNLGIGVNSVTAEANDSATLDLQVSGNNTVLNDAVIKATNSADVNTELSAFNFSLLAGGGRSRIESTLTSNTTGTIGGNFNAKTAAIDINSTRSSRVSQSSGAGGIIAINDSEAKNTLTSASILTIDGLSTDTDKGLNKWSISNKSDNTMDIVTSDGSGGFITLSSSEIKSDFNTRTETIVKNSNINSKDNVGFTAENKAVIKDSATSASGGFISCNSQNVKKSYFSASKLTFKDSKVEAKNLELTSHAEVKSPDNLILEYRGRSGGFVTVNSLTVENSLYQTSEIDIQNSILHATNDAVIHALTSSGYKQKIDSRSGGFVTVPTAILRLYSNNNNTISLDAQSKVLADSKLKIDFNSNSDLYTSSIAVSRNFEGEPSAYSYLYYAVNNTLNDNGSLQAGELVDIDFMNNSVNNLTQNAYAECHAAIAFTDEKGLLSRSINNAITVASNADITSGNSVNISYLTGAGTESSRVAYKNVYYAAFGVPIPKTGSKPQISNSHSKTLKLDGKIVAGAGNTKYLKINRDGTVNTDESKGISSSDYTLFDNTQVDGATIKSKTISSIDVQIENVTFKLNDIDLKIQNTENIINDIETKITTLQTELNNIDTLISDGAVYKNIQVENNNNEFYEIVNNDVKSASGISDEVYALITQKYKTKLDEVKTTNEEISKHNTDPANVNDIQEFVQAPSIVEFLNSYTGEDIAQDEKNAFITQYNAAYNDRMTANSSGVHIYTDLEGNKYIGATKVVDADSNVSWQEITNMNEQITEYKNKKAPYDTQLANYNETKTSLNDQKNNLINERAIAQNRPDSDYAKSDDDGQYSIVFNNIKAQNSVIAITGGDVDNTNITGKGNFIISPSGLKIDNYSTRSLIFNTIEFDTLAAANSLKINDKTYSEFLNKLQALNTDDAYHYKYGKPKNRKISDIMHTKPVPSFDNLPTDGVHYISQSSGQASDIIINNYYDVNHPFASTFNIPNPIMNSNIIFQNTTGTGSLSVWNESGAIIFAVDTIANSKMDLYAPNSSIITVLHNDSNNAKFNFPEDSNMFAGRKIIILADEVDIKGNIDIGYKDRAINITNDMLLADNLITDATSGEKNLINLGGNAITPYLNDGINYGNIKAIYKDGQIYLYNIPELTNGGLQIKSVNNEINQGKSTGTISANVNYVSGYSNIDITNETNKTLNIENLSNIKNEAVFEVPNLNIDNLNKTENVISNAVTNITSDGEISVSGRIRNSVTETILGNNFENGGQLNITSNKGISIYESFSDSDIVSSVLAGGNVTLTNKNSGNILIDGNIENKGTINIVQENAGDILLSSIINEEDGLVSVSNTNSGDILIDSIASIVSQKGNIVIDNVGTSTIYLAGPLVAKDGEVIIHNSNGAIYSYSYITAMGDVEINNLDENLIIGAGEENQIIGTTNGNISITNINGNLVLRENAVIANLSENDGNEGNGITITNIITEDNKAQGMYLNGYILNTASGDINILNYGEKEAEIAGEIVNAVGNIKIYNANESLTFNGKITADKGSIDIMNSGTDDLFFDISSHITANKDINITNEDGGKLVVDGTITSNTGNITLTNSNTDILIGEFASVNDNYITAKDGNVTINQTDGNIINVVTDPTAGAIHQNYDIGNPDGAYKTLISAKKDLIINIIDGNIGSAPDGAAEDTKASSRDYTNSINVNVGGTVTATAKNNNSIDTRIINIRSTESDMKIKKIDVDGDVLLTAADWKQADSPTGSTDPDYYRGYSVKNAAGEGNYAITGQNISIISSNEIGEENNKLTVLQDTLGNPDSTLNLFAEKSIYFDGKSNDANEDLSVGTMRTKSAGGTIGVELSSDANIDTVIAGGTINIKQKAKELTINKISMYGNNEIAGDTSEDILYPHDRIGATCSGNGRIVLKALDAYTNGESESSINVKEAYILGLGLGISDVELQGDNIVFNAISKSNMSNKPVVFDIQGVSENEVNAVANSTRSDYKYAGGHYLADNTNVTIETNSDNNHGAVINTVYAKNADVKTNNTNLTVNYGFIDEYGTFVNGFVNAGGYYHSAVVNNKTNNLVGADYQMYTKKTGDFNLGLDGTIVLKTNAPVVHYNPYMLVNGYNSENSFTRLTLKENIVQQAAKSIHEKLMPTDVNSLKAIDVKLDTSDIIMNEIINFNLSNDSDELEENQNISLKN